MEDLRTRISRAAQDIFLHDGIEGVSMRKVADKVGVTAPAIYRHFRGKDELLDEIILSGLVILEEYLKPAFDAPTPFERLNGLIDRYLAFALEQPRYFEFAFLVPGRPIGRFSEEIAKHGWETFRFALEQVSLCIDQGVFRRDDPQEIAVLVWAEVHGLVTLFKMERLGPDPDRFRVTYQRAVKRLLEGLKSPS